MKNTLTLLLLALSASAFAEGSNFDGAYLGLHGGYDHVYSQGADYVDGNHSGYSFSNELGPGLLGVFGGFNKTLSSNVLVGIEAEYEFHKGDRTSLVKFNGHPDTIGGNTVKSESRDAASIRAKLGYIFNENRTFAYVTAGYALEKLKNTYTDVLGTAGNDPGTSETNSNWFKGWTAGLGVEHFVNDKISIKGEYRRSGFSDETDNTPMYGSIQHVKFDSYNSLRLGVAYHF